MKLSKYFIAIAVLMAVVMTGCSTINRFDEYDLTGTDIALDLRSAPEPSVNVDYSYGYDYYDEDDPNADVLNAVQFSTDLIKATEAAKLEDKLYNALENLYLPEFIAELTFDRLVNTLEANAVDRISDSDVILEIDVYQYGVETWSNAGDVRMVIRMEARLFHKYDREIVWQRFVEASENVSGGYFGFDNILGNVFTIQSLAGLSERELEEGFKRLTVEVMEETIGLLQEDLRAARRR